MSSGEILGAEFQERPRTETMATTREALPGVDEAQTLYIQGLTDYVSGRRNTDAARAYIGYWMLQNEASK